MKRLYAVLLFLPSFVLAQPTNCLIELKECVRSPITAGTFSEEFDNAGNNSSRCLRRAKETAMWCGNRGGVETKATFTLPDGSSISSAYKSGSTACIIDLPRCTVYPQIVGFFSDNYEGSNTNISRCLLRAKDYSNYCGNSPGVTTTAKFVNGQGETFSHSYTAETSCAIQQAYCPANEYAVGHLPDDFNGSGQNAEACMGRALDYAAYCASTSGMSHTAIFTKADGTRVSFTHKVP